MKEMYPLDRPCEYCGERVVDHTPNELRSCVLDIEAREQEAEARTRARRSTLSAR